MFYIILILAAIFTMPAKAETLGIKIEGIYQLNLAKSTVGPGFSKSITLNFVGDQFVAVGIGADDKPYTVTYTFIVDGKPHPVTGAPRYDTSTYTALDSYAFSISRAAKDGKVVETGIGIIDPISKTLTHTSIGPDGSYKRLLVFEKQQ